MKLRTILIMLGLALTPLMLTPASADDAWRPLFNGKDTTDWKMTGPGQLKVEDGELVTYGGMGLLWYPGEKFGNCEIRIVFKLTKADDNSGFFIRIPSEPKNPMQAVNEGYEVQIDNNGDDWHRTGCLYSLTQAKAKVSPALNEWATMIIRLEGPRTLVTINDQVVTDFREGDATPPKAKVYEPNRGLRPDEGYIGVQNHGGHANVRFKEVSVRPLPKPSK